MYHLYTVDIICTGLPLTDLNTLEFEHPDKVGWHKFGLLMLLIVQIQYCK